MRKIALTAAVAFGVGAALAANSVKIISCGWNQPSLEELSKDVATYEKQAPFDGLCFSIGSSVDVFNPEAFSSAAKAEMQKSLAVYTKIKFTTWKYNFLHVLIDQNIPQWFDDDYWKNVTANWTTAAELAKNGGFVGINFDPEEYGVYPVTSYFTTSYWLKTDTKHTASQYLAEARKRGRQIGASIFAVFPEMVLWSYYWWSFDNADMMGEFCNGLLEAMPSKAKLVDGDEWNGYCAQNAAAYETMKAKNQTGYGMLDESLTTKHMQQGGLAPAFYLDAYTVEEGTATGDDCLYPTINKISLDKRAQYFAENLKAAKANATGGHVWIYGEQLTWWPTDDIADWETAIPGIRDVLFTKSSSSDTAISYDVSIPSPKVNLKLTKSAK